MHEVAVNQRDSVRAALDCLVSFAEGKSLTPEELVKAVRTIDAESPTMGKRIKEMLGKIASSLASSTIVLGLKGVFGIP